MKPPTVLLRTHPETFYLHKNATQDRLLQIRYLHNTNNQAERDVRPVKVQQRTSGGCWRTLQGLADFTIVQSYLSTATKWGLDHYDALYQLFTTGAWLPPAAQPC